jgi:hypothetical protein
MVLNNIILNFVGVKHNNLMKPIAFPNIESKIVL